MTSSPQSTFTIPTNFGNHGIIQVRVAVFKDDSYARISAVVTDAQLLNPFVAQYTCTYRLERKSTFECVFSDNESTHGKAMR